MEGPLGVLSHGRGAGNRQAESEAVASLAAPEEGKGGTASVLLPVALLSGPC